MTALLPRTQVSLVVYQESQAEEGVREKESQAGEGVRGEGRSGLPQ